MANVLYITCNLKPCEQSRSLTIGSDFLQKYRECNPKDRIDFLDLYRDPIQRIDADVLNGWAKLRSGQSIVALNDDEQRKIGRISALAEQFAAADKYVIVTPMWNFGFPAEFKMYIDAICVVGKTFTYTDQGAVGLLAGKGKKCLHIHSSGGFHLGKEEDHSVPYLQTVMHYMGVEHVQCIVIEGVDALPHMAAEIMRQGREECRFVATTF